MDQNLLLAMMSGVAVAMSGLGVLCACWLLTRDQKTALAHRLMMIEMKALADENIKKAQECNESMRQALEVVQDRLNALDYYRNQGKK